MYAHRSRSLPLPSELVFEFATDTSRWSNWWSLGTVSSHGALRELGDRLVGTWNHAGPPVDAEWRVLGRRRQIVHVGVDAGTTRLAHVTFTVAPWFDQTVFEIRVSTTDPVRGSFRLARRLERDIQRFTVDALASSDAFDSGSASAENTLSSFPCTPRGAVRSRA